jgi:hypothetical protein
MDELDLVGTTEASFLLRLSPMRVIQLANANMIPCYRLGGRHRSRAFPRQALLDYKRQREAR